MLEDTKWYLLAVGWKRAWVSKFHSAFSFYMTVTLLKLNPGVVYGEPLPMSRHPMQNSGSRAGFMVLCRLTGRLTWAAIYDEN